MKIGLLIMDEDPRDALDVARAADRGGIDSIWTIDYYNRSSLTRAASFAVATERVGVGTSVTPLFARTPLALACAARDVQVMAGGRFTLGVGSSTRRMNADWYGVALDHPAPRVAERIELVRKLMEHRSGPFEFEGRFDSARLAHFERADDVGPVPILGAAVGSHMVRAVVRSADGLVGHPIASAANLAALRSETVETADRAGRAGSFILTSQVIAAIGDDHVRAERLAAQQVGFYTTVKGYDALFSTEVEAAARAGARDAFGRGDVAGVAEAAAPLVDERAVFGTEADVAAKLKRYADVLDVALLYTPHYGVDAAEVKRNELALIEMAAGSATDLGVGT